MKKYSIENSRLIEFNKDKKLSWIEMTNPTLEEIDEVICEYNIPKDYIHSVLDAQEVPRVEGLNEDKPYLFILSYPIRLNENTMTTRPISIIKAGDVLITVIASEPEYMSGIKDKYLNMDKRVSIEILITEIAWKICSEFVKFVKKIDVQIEKVENYVVKKADSKVFTDMIGIQKSLIRFKVATEENEPVIEAIFEAEGIDSVDNSDELLHDLKVENKQARVMISESSEIIDNLSDLYSNLISYNLNVAMKILTSITIVLTVPTIIGGLWGMNVSLPFEKNPLAFWILIIVSILISLGIVKFLKNKDYL